MQVLDKKAQYYTFEDEYENDDEDEKKNDLDNDSTR
jgi:hypothetical protein